MIKKSKKFASAAIAAVLCVMMTISTVSAATDNDTETVVTAVDETATETATEITTETESETDTEVESSELESKLGVQSNISSEKNLVLGDILFDGQVKLIDSLIIQKIVLNGSEITEDELLCGDVNVDGEIRLIDAILIQKYVLKMLGDNSGIGQIVSGKGETQPETEETQPVTEETEPTTEPETEETQPLEVVEKTLTLGAGEKFTINLAGAETAQWACNNTDVATVSQNQITALNPGTAQVSAQTDNKVVIYNLTVKSAPTSMSLNKTTLTLGVGETFDLNSSLPSGCGAYSVIYSSNNSKIADVKAAGGLVTAKGVGTATITAKAYNGVTASCVITVKKAPTSMSLNKTTLTLGVGETFDLNSSLPSGCGAYSIAYSSNNSTVAEVKAGGGLVTAKATGTATITAKAYNGVTASCVITVKKAPTSISLNKTTLTLNIGETFDLNSSLPSGCGAYSIVYSSNNSKVAEVKVGGGLVTAKAVGTATITAKAYNGKTATCKVTVSERSYTDDDLYCLAAVIWQESGSYWLSDRLQIYVGNVVMNRVDSSLFPNTIRGVLTSPYAYGPMAWSGISIPTPSNSIEKAAIERCYNNARKILEGYRPLPKNVVFQAGFVQGNGVYAYESGQYFCYL